jgi:tRNA(fMet)-specific endonuclease VapC
MTTGYLLDTNIAIAILIREKSVLDFIFETAHKKIPVYFSVITECEVLSGLRSEEMLEKSNFLIIPVAWKLRRLSPIVQDR